MTEGNAAQEDLMQSLGIRQVPMVSYLYRDWRYSRLDDAVAQARRDATGEGLPWKAD